MFHNNKKKKIEVTVAYRLPLSFDSLLKGAAFHIYGQMCALEKASQCDSLSEPRDLFNRINKLLLRFIFNKAFFIKSYAAKYNNNKGGIRIALITCLYDCAHIKYAWSLWKGRLCRLNANSVNTAISGLLSMFKLVVLEEQLRLYGKLCKTFYLEAILFLHIMCSGCFSPIVFYFENICMETRSLFLTSTSALAAYRLREVIILCDIIIISMATSSVFFF